MEAYYPASSHEEATADALPRHNSSGAVDRANVVGDYDMLVLQPPRCSVFPDLSADYYCVDCRCFVSSHGHVRGAHRNHRFLTIREAAELHVPAMKAWTARCEEQLQKAESIMLDLGNASRALDTTLREQDRSIEAAYAAVVDALTRRKDALKRQLRARVSTEQSAATQAWKRMDDLMRYYSAYLEHCAGLLVNVPPMEAMDTATVLWSADVMRTSELLGSAAQVDDVWLPDLLVPQLVSYCTPEATNELLHLNFTPFVSAEGSRLPTMFDVRPFQLFPVEREEEMKGTGSPNEPPQAWRASAQGRSRGLVDSRQHDGEETAQHLDDTDRHTPSRCDVRDRGTPAHPQATTPDFTLQLVPPTDPQERSTIHLSNDNRTLTRRPRAGEQPTTGGAATSLQGCDEHLLVRGSCRLSGVGVYGWSVHVDRLGESGGAESNGDTNVAPSSSRILAGLSEDDSARGAGVVWDGLHIIGPSEEEVFTIGNKSWTPTVHTTLQFVLEIVEDEETGGYDSAKTRKAPPPSPMLHCYFEEAYVTTVFLPPSGVWRPAVSVLSAEDQLTVRPLAAGKALGLAMLSSSPAPSPSQQTKEPQRHGKRYGPGWLTNTPHRPTNTGNSRHESYSPELREILDYAERMRREDKKIAWL